MSSQKAKLRSESNIITFLLSCYRDAILNTGRSGMPCTISRIQLCYLTGSEPDQLLGRLAEIAGDIDCPEWLHCAEAFVFRRAKKRDLTNKEKSEAKMKGALSGRGTEPEDVKIRRNADTQIPFDKIDKIADRDYRDFLHLSMVSGFDLVELWVSQLRAHLGNNYRLLDGIRSHRAASAFIAKEGGNALTVLEAWLDIEFERLRHAGLVSTNQSTSLHWKDCEVRVNYDSKIIHLYRLLKWPTEKEQCLGEIGTPRAKAVWSALGQAAEEKLLYISKHSASKLRKALKTTAERAGFTPLGDPVRKEGKGYMLPFTVKGVHLEDHYEPEKIHSLDSDLGAGLTYHDIIRDEKQKPPSEDID